ncbi:MAG: hypothetical protein MK097_00675, partial [Dechloromonas sp.]|nr:hypothetical protein [Dechloromonas sp.]
MKTGTGWLKPDDAWLVLDRNGNGTIDSGRELFGVDTQVTVNAETRPATSGFEALSALDRGTGTAGSAGYGDKIFDAKDADFTRVRLWQDLNQDGVSQANELFTLAQKGVTSISLTPTTEATPLGNGNVITGRATVRFTNNTTTQVDSVAVSDRTAGNLELVDNPFYREFTTAIPHTAAAAAMPEMRGSGMVRDMREALSLGNANSTSLASVLQQYTQAKTRDAQIALLDQLIFRWGDTSTMQTSITTDRRPSATGPFTAIEAWGLANLPLFMKINALEQFNGTSILSRFVVASGNAFTVAPLDSWRIEALEAAWAALR